MKLINIGGIIFTLSFIFYVVYNQYFGWNLLPETENERLCDRIFLLTNYIAIGIYLTPLITLYRKSVEKMEKDEK